MFTRLAAALFALGIAIVSPGATAQTVFVYDGPGICDGCADAAAHAARLAGARARRIDAHHLTQADLRGADLVIIGGGEDTVTIAHGMGPEGMSVLRQWVRAGGRYLGLCAGAYLAGDVIDDAGRRPGLRLFAGNAYAQTPYAATIERVEWFGQTLRLYAQEGPGFALSPEFYGPDARGTVFARWSSGTPAGLEARFGQGHVVLSGPHPEADASWLAVDGLPPEPALPGPALAAGLIARLLSVKPG